MTCKLLTPDQLFFEGEIQAVTLPGYLGELGILENHAPLVTILSKGKLLLTLKDDSPKVYTVEGGIAEVRNNVVSILADHVES